MSNEPTVSSQHRPLKFDEVTNDAYGTEFAASCEVEEIARGVRLDGICPRCLGEMSHHEVDSYVRGVRRNATPRLKTATQVVPVLCTCKKAHDGRPKGDEGCGAYWSVEVTPR